MHSRQWPLSSSVASFLLPTYADVRNIDDVVTSLKVRFGLRVYDCAGEQGVCVLGEEDWGRRGRENMWCLRLPFLRARHKR